MLRLRSATPTVCVFPHLVFCLVRNGIEFLCLMQASRILRIAQVSRTCGKLRAIRLCGTNRRVGVFNIVVVDIAVVVHAIYIVIVVGRTKPPKSGQMFYNPIPYDTALRRISKSFSIAFYPRTE